MRAREPEIVINYLAIMGAEMCIRDRANAVQPVVDHPRALRGINCGLFGVLNRFCHSLFSPQVEIVAGSALVR